jgi:N-terminal acetyltransferase B complex catalytic subunit
VSEELYNGFFVDLFVRASNKLAIMMYTNLGYVIYRQVLGYYSGTLSEDAYGKIHISI